MATTINGTTGNDVIGPSSNAFGVPPTIPIAQPNNDDFIIFGLGGDDRIQTGDRNDQVTTLGGNDDIRVGNGNNTVNAGDGNNNVVGGTGIDVITTGSGSDTINAGDGNNTVTAGGGNDTINTGTGDDTINAGDGNDTVFSGTGQDDVVLGAGDDRLLAETDGNDDEVDGGEGNDYVVDMGGGQDRAFGGRGADEIHTGNGDDRIDYSADGIYGENICVFNEGMDTRSNGGKVDAFIVTGRNLTLDIIDGGDQRDTVVGTSGGDVLVLGSRTGTQSGATQDSIQRVEIFDMGAGNDVVDLTSATLDYDLGNGVTGGTYYGGTGTDALLAPNRVNGNGGNANDTIYGGDGTDYIFGGSGDDQLFGAGPNGPGLTNTLGDGVRDIFAFSPGYAPNQDVINNFEDGIDKIRLKGFVDGNGVAITTFTQLQSFISGSTINLPGPGQINVNFLGSGSLSADDFQLVL